MGKVRFSPWIWSVGICNMSHPQERQLHRRNRNRLSRPLLCPFLMIHLDLELVFHAARKTQTVVQNEYREVQHTRHVQDLMSNT